MTRHCKPLRERLKISPGKVIYHAIVETTHLSGVLRKTLALDRGILVEPVTVNCGAEQ